MCGVNHSSYGENSVETSPKLELILSLLYMVVLYLVVVGITSGGIKVLTTIQLFCANSCDKMLITNLNVLQTLMRSIPSNATSKTALWP